MSRSRRFLAGISFGYLNQILIMGVGLWLTPFLLARIGSHGFGLWLVGTQILAYLLLLDLGVVALLSREVSFTVGRAGGSIESASELPEILGKGLRIILWQMPVVILVMFAAWFAFPSVWEDLRRPFLPVLIAFVVMFPMRILLNALIGLQDLAFTGRVQILTWAVTTGTTVTLVYFGLGLDALAWGWISGQLAQHGSCFLRLKNIYPRVLPKRLPRVTLAESIRELRRGIWVSTAQISQVLLFGSDLLIIGKILGPEGVIPYACTAKLITVLSNQPNLLMQNAGPALSEIRMSAQKSRLFSVCSALTQGMLLASGAVFCVIVMVNEAFVQWWVGTNLYGGPALTVCLAVMMVLRHWNTTLAYSNFSFGYEKRISLSALGDGAVTVISSLFLVGWLGPAGAALGSILGAVTVSLPVNLGDLATETGSTRRQTLRNLSPLFLRIIFTGTVLMTITHLWLPRGIFQIAIATCFSLAFYAVIVWPLAARDPLRSYIEPRLLGLRSMLRRTAVNPAAAMFL